MVPLDLQLRLAERRVRDADAEWDRLNPPPSPESVTAAEDVIMRAIDSAAQRRNRWDA
jgi:hypothetical protein